jgi:hypothetical protein
MIRNARTAGYSVLCVGLLATLAGCSGADTGTSSGTSAAITTTSQALESATLPGATISVWDVGVNADFALGGYTVFRSGETDDCVARMNASPPDTPAGTLTVNSPSLGAPLVMEPNPTFSNGYLGIPNNPPFVFPVGQRVEVTVATTGSSTDPPLELTRLHSAEASYVNVLSPSIPSDGPNAGIIVIDSTKPLEVTWQPPAGQQPGKPNKLVVSLWDVVGPTVAGEVRCGFDLDRGWGVMPASLLHQIKTAVDPANPIQWAAFRVLVGDRVEYRGGGVSYVIELGAGSVQTTNIPVDNPATLE